MASYPKYKSVKKFVLDQVEEKNMQPGDRLPSEAELSRELNVSAITIKKALSDLAADGIIQRIKGKGSFIAEAKNKDTSHMVAMLFALDDIRDSAFSSLILGAQAYLSRYNYSMLVECTGENLENAKSQLARLIDHGVDGFIFYLYAPDRMLELIDIAQRSKSVVMVDRRPSSRDSSYVGCNNVGGATKAVNHLISYGHTKIGYAHFNAYLNSEMERYLGYCSALRAGGLDPDCQHHIQIKGLDSAELVETVLAGRATAYFTANDDCALILMRELEKAGLRVPEDVSIVGFDNNAQVKSQNIPLTTIEQDFEEIGRQSASLLLRLLQGRVCPDTQLLLGTKLIDRASVCPPKVTDG